MLKVANDAANERNPYVRNFSQAAKKLTKLVVCPIPSAVLEYIPMIVKIAVVYRPRVTDDAHAAANAIFKQLFCVDDKIIAVVSRQDISENIEERRRKQKRLQV